MKVIVLSCDKNEETFLPFAWCLEKYWYGHPKVVYLTETIKNPFFETISLDYPLDKWTVRIRESLKQIDDEQILLMVDDCFIRKTVDRERIEYASKHLIGKIACFNFEQSFDPSDEVTDLKSFKLRKHGSQYEVSLLCGLWNRYKLINVLSQQDSDPWSVEYNQPNCGYDYYINSGDFIIDWGYRTWKPAGIYKGKWCHEAKQFLDSIGIYPDYSIKGFSDIW